MAMKTDALGTAKKPEYGGGENLNLQSILLQGKNLSLGDRLSYFSAFIKELNENKQFHYARMIVSETDREVSIIDPCTGNEKKMLMFGSNNYLGLANHPHVCNSVRKAINSYGVGIGGPPLLNGYSSLMHKLEERLSALKHAESTIIFPCGYSTNLGLISGLLTRNDMVFYDEKSHASFYDGLAAGRIKGQKFHHNNIEELNTLLSEKCTSNGGETFVNVEGVYSMDGDLAPLDRIVKLCKKNRAILIVDDAHGTGVMGENGSGTSEYFGVSKEIDVNMGTFSKAFAVMGGFISASKPIIEYLRFFARPYMFSASIPPVIIAAVLAGLDVIENEPERRKMLHDNVKYVVKGLRHLDIVSEPKAGIIALRVPDDMNIRDGANQFHQAGIFLNAIEYPAVPVNEQRYRMSIMATHTREDLDKLIASVEEVWYNYNQR
jgi:glycine C-acetyltransferase